MRDPQCVRIPLLEREDLFIFLFQQSIKSIVSTEIKSEANLLDLNDVEYADASDDEGDYAVIKDREEIEAESMTPAEAENLLSSR